MPSTPEQIAFLEALAEANRAEAKLAEAATKLPPVPVDFVGETELHEPGYLRISQLVVENGEDSQDFHGWTDGWDDMSETGACQYVVLDGEPYAQPDNLDWD